jgi:hypothetical protein
MCDTFGHVRECPFPDVQLAAELALGRRDQPRAPVAIAIRLAAQELVPGNRAGIFDQISR